MSGYEEVPTVLGEWVERWSGRSLDASASELIEAGCRGLDAALALPDGDRRAAHALLAADASLTAAVEQLADDPDPAGGLRAMIDRVAGTITGAGESE